MNPKLFIGLLLGIAIASTSTILNHNPFGPEYAFFDSLWPAVIGICVATTIFFDFHAFVHSKQIKKGKSPNHQGAWTVRFLVCFAIASIMHIYEYEWVKVLLLTGIAMCWGGIIFPLRLNWYMNWAWDRIDDDDNGSWWDKFLYNSFPNPWLAGFIILLAIAWTLTFLYLR